MANRSDTAIKRPVSVFSGRMKQFLRNPANIYALSVCLLFVAAAFFPADSLPHDPIRVNLDLRLRPPSWRNGGDSAYFLGTDQLGRDLLSRLVFAARYTLLVSLLAASIGCLVGSAAGLLAGYRKGNADAFVSRLAEMQLAFPVILLLIVAVAVLGNNLRNLVLILGISSWAGFARVVRGSTLVVRNREFVEAARCTGANGFRIITRHILPNVSGSLIVLFTLEMARMILLESGLSFLALGVQPPLASWGSMLGDGRANLFQAPWLTSIPGLAIVLIVTGINFLGDGIGDLLDPTRSA